MALRRCVGRAAGLIALTFALAVPAADDRPLDLSLPNMGQPADQVMSPGDEERIGRELMRQVRQQLPLVEDPLLRSYVADLGTRLASHSGSNEDFDFFVVANDAINAFALPGGHIGVHTGLISAAETESELASVLAHEIAHVTQRHLARQRLEGGRAGLRTAALILAGLVLATQSGNPDAGSAAIMGGMASGVQSQLNFSREHEREADRIGLETLADAGFAPEGMPAFFERLMQANRYRGEPPPFLSTHPLTRERIADARARAQSLRADDRFENPAFAYMRARVMALRGDDAAERVAAFDERLGNNGATPAERYGRAVALIEAGRAKEAITELRGLMEAQESYALFHATLAEAHLAAGAPDAALAILDEGLSLYPGDYALHYRRIEALLAAGDGRTALQVASSASRSFPDDLALLELRARAAEATGDSAEAALATAQFYAARGDLRGGLRQLERVLDDPTADGYQRSRAQALRERWRASLEQPR